MSIQSPTEKSQIAMQAKTQAIPPRELGDDLPSGGTVGQVLTKTATGSEWADVPEELPEGGSNGQFLKKTADGPAWGSIPEELPDYSQETAGKVLTVVEGATAEDPNEVSWENPATELPAGGTAGQVLTKTASGCEWAAAAGGELKPQLTKKINLTLSTTGAIPVVIGGDVKGTNNARRYYSISSTSAFSTSKNHAAGSVTPFLFDGTAASTTSSLYPSKRLVGRSYTDVVIPDTDPEVHYLLGSDAKELVENLPIRLNDASRTQVGKLCYKVRESFAAKKWDVELTPVCIYWSQAVSSEDSLTVGLTSNGIADTKYLDNASCYAVKDDTFEISAGNISSFFTESTGQNPFQSIVLFE